MEKILSVTEFDGSTEGFLIKTSEKDIKIEIDNGQG